MDIKLTSSAKSKLQKNSEIVVSWPLLTLLLSLSLLGLISFATWTVGFGSQTINFLEIDQLNSNLSLSEKENRTLRSYLTQISEKVSSLELLIQEVSALNKIKGKNLFANPIAIKQLPTSQIHDFSLPIQKQIFESVKGDLNKRINHLGKIYADTYLKLAYTPSIWPADGILNDRFGNIQGRFEIGKSSFHQGIDISTRIGNPVRATANGVVFSVKYHPTYGKRVILKHQFGISTVYAHLSNYHVKTGVAVHRGQVIGFVGNTGRSTGPHLHYEVRIGNIAVNPMRYISKYASNLLPRLGS